MKVWAEQVGTADRQDYSLAADEALGIEDGARRVIRGLILGRITNEALVIGERDV